MPTRSALPGAVGDVFQVGATDLLVQGDPQAARELLIGSGWYLNSHPIQNTYTAISYLAYKQRYCVYYEGDTCPQLLDTLFSTEPTTGLERVDLLGVSSLLLIRQDFPAARLAHPPAGWQIAGRTPYTVLWTRRTPVPGAGGVVWTSPGTSVSAVTAGDDGTSFHVDAVPADGGTVVLSLLDWPGYATDVGSLADPVDGYLVTVHLPGTAQGGTRARRLPPAGLDRRGHRVGARPGGRRRLVALLRRTPPPRPVELGTDQPRPRSVSTVWPLSLTKVSTSWRPSVSERTFVALLRERRIADPGQPGRMGVVDIRKLKPWTIESP